jgi:hypothetical protein
MNIPNTVYQGAIQIKYDRFCHALKSPVNERFRTEPTKSGRL